MPLTDYQRLVACCPYRYPLNDLFEVMEIMARPEERRVFGDATLGILFSLHKAAKSRRLNAPVSFQMLMQDIDKNVSKYTIYR